MKRIAVLLMLVVLAISTVAWAQSDPYNKITKQQKSDIEAVAKCSFPGKRVTFYKNSVFIRDGEEMILFSKVLPTERALREIWVRSDYETPLTLGFLVQVADFINCPSVAPSAFGKGITIKKN
ncbi:MAG: hypothetical protein A3J76_04360 [Candidatus Moranbacteria bacterium RBG_13_45_13]|nr:MAG: hypothetical protein A3J76_04360 [Candidatus Moranbacteria bacterium RBG_13_45_13]